MNIKQRKPKKRRNPWLPVIGLLLAVLFGVMAYGLTPTVIDVLNLPLFNPDPPFPIEGDRLIVTVIIWIVLFTIMTAIVAVLVGGDPDEKQGIQIRKDFEKRKKERQKMKRGR